MMARTSETIQWTSSPAMTGAAVGMGVVVLTAIGGWLYRVVPPARRKPVAVTMMSIGALLLASTLLRAWGVVEGSDLTDAIMIGVLSGGFLIFAVGFALYRHMTRVAASGVRGA